MVKNNLDSANKNYCVEVGRLNARSGYRQQEMTHIMGNSLFTDLKSRGCAGDVGVVTASERNAQGKQVPVTREIDFIATSGGKRFTFNPLTPWAARKRPWRKTGLSPSPGTPSPKSSCATTSASGGTTSRASSTSGFSISCWMRGSSDPVPHRLGTALFPFLCLAAQFLCCGS